MQAPSLYPEIVESPTLPGKGHHGYYRRNSDGKIVTSPVWPSFRADMEFKGYTFLPQYGVWTVSGPGQNTNVVDLRGRHFNPIEEPWRLILQHPDGVRAFPAWQIIAYRWHIRPPYREVTFPQLEGVEVFDYFCPECDTGIFSSTDQQDAIDQLRIHVTSRTNDQHAYRPEDLRALGVELGIDFFAPRRARQAAARQAQRQEPEPVAADLTGNDGPVKKPCPVCGEEVTVAFGHFTKHVNAHKQEAGGNPGSEGAGLNELS